MFLCDLFRNNANVKGVVSAASNRCNTAMSNEEKEIFILKALRQSPRLLSPLGGPGCNRPTRMGASAILLVLLVSPSNVD